MQRKTWDIFINNGSIIILNNLGKNLHFSYLSQLVSIVTGFLTSVILLRNLQVEEFGEYSFYVSFIVIDEKEIVSNMHEAYEKINFEDSGYGVFISGPSKTADIEQSLVIGAHGPKSGYVIFTKSWYNC